MYRMAGDELLVNFSTLKVERLHHGENMLVEMGTNSFPAQGSGTSCVGT